MIVAGALQLEPMPGVDVSLEIVEDDWPTRYPFLNEPKAELVMAEQPTPPPPGVYGTISWIGIPRVDGRAEVEVTVAGNKVPRFAWSVAGTDPEAFEQKRSAFVVAPSVPLIDRGAPNATPPEPPVDTGLVAEFAPGVYVTGTLYTFTGPGVAAQDGPGPEVTITGSGSVDGAIKIQTGVGSLRHRVGDAPWSNAISMASLPATIPALGVDLSIPDDDHAGLELQLGTLFLFYARGRFTIRLSAPGFETETYERFRVGDPLWFASLDIPAGRRSKLVSVGSWVGEVRPPTTPDQP